MSPPFDLFRFENDGSATWLGICADLDAAAARVKTLAATSPGTYFIFSQASQQKLFISSDGKLYQRAAIARAG